MKNEEVTTNGIITINTIAKMANVSTATVSYVINERTDKKVAEATRQKILDLCRKYNYQKGAARKRPKDKKPVTIDDIAKEAGVSTATVSYIINNHQDVKIREETRRKVLQICNLRQFFPSSTARALRSADAETDKNNTIGLCFNRPTSTFYHSEECLDLICSLQKFLYERDYKTLLLPPVESDSISVQKDIDGIICIDLSEQQFYTLKESYYVPIVAIDMTIKDSLFFKSYNDFSAIINYAKTQLKTSHLIFVTSKYQNQPYMNKLKRALADDLLYVVSTYADLIEFLRQHKDEHIVFSDISLAICSFPYIAAEKTAVICNNAKITLPSDQMVKIYLPSELKVKNAVEMLEYAIQRKESEPHTFKLSPQSL
ncbi:MAG: LacI family DNA-binding transcriptional regulator [Barnesiella intestinihominis]|jgi:putative transcriptional regulator, lacI family|uniref:LacI family DNA-binding transcriptional regulator n=1 Tax=[Ruminococcus] torques TaxID=33039 RepID=UPI0015ADFF91